MVDPFAMVLITNFCVFLTLATSIISALSELHCIIDECSRRIRNHSHLKWLEEIAKDFP